LAAEVDRDRNPGVDLDAVPAKSTRRLWWRCREGHVSEATVESRARGAGCPACAGRYTAPITETHPEVAAQVDPDRNPNVDLDEVTAGSARRLWWRCAAGHVWEAPVYDRARGKGCPTCAHRHSPTATANPASPRRRAHRRA